MATPSTCPPPQSCPTRCTGAPISSSSPTSHRRYSATVAPQPSGAGAPQPGGDSRTTSSRPSSATSGPHTASVSGLPCTITTGMAPDPTEQPEPGPARTTRRGGQPRRVAGCGSARHQTSRTGTGGASRRRRKTTPWRRYWVEGALGGHADAAAGGDHRQPVVDVVGLLDLGAAVGRPEVGGGRAGAGVDGQDAVGEVGQPQLPAPGQRVVRGHRAVPRLEADDGAVEPAGSIAVRPADAHHRDVARALGEPAGRRVGAHQVQLDVGVPGGPAALELHGVLAHRRPGVADAQPAVPASAPPGPGPRPRRAPAAPGPAPARPPR